MDNWKYDGEGKATSGRHNREGEEHSYLWYIPERIVDKFLALYLTES